ncbi:sensor histidine kinase [Paenibacillaceae bacterium WGS1546]|uniref:sensor histidine kinase n=1 Tax=Cohnella sp. WGS1546 TaxID=3366810 RepID=UPI00372D645D
MIKIKHRMNFQKKLFLCYSIIVLLIASVAFSLIHSYITGSLRKRAVDNLDNLTAKTADQFESVLKEMDRIAAEVSANPTIANYASRISSTKTNYSEQLPDYSANDPAIHTLISINTPNTSTMRISIYNQFGSYISMGLPDSSFTIKQKVSSPDYRDWYARLVPERTNRILIPHSDFWSDDRDLKMVSLIRNIKDINTLVSYGLVEVQQPLSKLEPVFTQLQPSPIQTWLLSDKGNLIYSSGKESTNQAEVRELIGSLSSRPGNSGSFETRLSAAETLISYQKSEMTGWFIVLIEPEKSLLQPVTVVSRTLLLVTMAIFLVTLLLIYLTTRYLTKPLRQLRISLKKVTFENPTLELAQLEHHNEIVQLNKAFEFTIRRLKHSMNQTVELRSSEAKAQLFALQAQMDPHFLYNTLSVISAAGQEEGAAKVTEMCGKFANMIRYSTSPKENTSVLLSDELEHTNNYLELMKERFEKHLNYTIHAHPQALLCRTPKLILQPIVENCFRHGFQGVKPPWTIDIRIEKMEGLWTIEIKDNGTGFTDAALAEINSKIRAFVDNPSIPTLELKLGGLALFNSFMRLHLLYGRKAVFKIENLAGSGSVIKIGGECVD